MITLAGKPLQTLMFEVDSANMTQDQNSVLQDVLFEMNTDTQDVASIQKGGSTFASVQDDVGECVNQVLLL